MSKFVGRHAELTRLRTLYDLKKSSLVVVKGRRRIGKSRLVAEFASQVQLGRFFNFSGLAPIEGLTAQDQRDHFAKKLGTHFEDWSDGFSKLSKELKPGDVVLFDEISWMGLKDPTFVPKLKAWWDTISLHQPHLLVVFCGSVSTWIEENILNSTAFFGRVSLAISLEPFSIPQAAQFLRKIGFKGSPYEQYQILSTLGGVPWYLEQINPRLMAGENIRQLCLQKDALLLSEFGRIFHDLFNGTGSTYKKILDVLAQGQKTLMQVRQAIDFGMSGTLSQMMENLITAGFVHKHLQWSIATGRSRKQSLYRLSDPYIRFYLKCIEPNRAQIEHGFYELSPAVLGFQVENLLLQNRALLLKKLGIRPSDFGQDGPYRQSKTLRHEGCQIDYLVQTRTKNLFVCEFKLRSRELGPEIIEEVQEKIRRFSAPRGFAVVPVLFHLGDVSEAVYTSNYFYQIIDIAEFLEEASC